MECKEYFCKNVGLCTKGLKKISNSTVFNKLKLVFHRRTIRSTRLSIKVTSNFAESYMASTAKITAGKRTDFSKRDGYLRRERSVVMAYNYRDFWLPKVFADKSGNDN